MEKNRGYQKVPALVSSNVTGVWACGDYSLVLKENGELHKHGSYSARIKRMMATRSQELPKLLSVEKQVKQISCSPHQFLLLRKDGELLVFFEEEQVVVMKDEEIRDIYEGVFAVKSNGQLFMIERANFVCLGFLPQLSCISTVSSDALIYLNNGNLYKIKRKDLASKGINGITEKELFLQDEGIISLNGRKVFHKWNPDTHKLFGPSFRKRVETLLLCWKRIQTDLSTKFPKVLIFEIIKLVDTIDSNLSFNRDPSIIVQENPLPIKNNNCQIF